MVFTEDFDLSYVNNIFRCYILKILSFDTSIIIRIYFLDIRLNFSKEFIKGDLKLFIPL